MREVTTDERRAYNNTSVYDKQGGGGGCSDIGGSPGATAVRHHEEDEDEEDPKSDSDSTVMMSGNSPFVSKSARYNFLQRSGIKISGDLPRRQANPLRAHLGRTRRCDRSIMAFVI